MKALITGANGHIGSHVVRACIEDGIDPVGFVRPGCDRRALQGVDVELREGDLLDVPSLSRAMAGIDVVFHVAAVHRNWADDEAKIMRPAVEGTRHVINIAKRAGVRRVVYTSTGATMGMASDPAKPLNEMSFLEDSAAMYVQSKIRAERVALSAAASGRIEVVVVNPSGVFGPLDYRLTPATRSVVGLLHGDPLFYAVSVTDVRDVAAGQVLAARRGLSGRRYLLTGDVVLPKQTAQIFQELAGIKIRTFRPPHFVARWLASNAMRKARRTGEDPAWTPEIVDMAFAGHLAYDSGRARTELGVSFRPAREVMRDTFRWLLFLGILEPGIASRIRGALGADAAPDPAWDLGTFASRWASVGATAAQ